VTTYILHNDRITSISLLYVFNPSRLALGLNQPPVLWVSLASPFGLKGTGHADVNNAWNCTFYTNMCVLETLRCIKQWVTLAVSVGRWEFTYGCVCLIGTNLDRKFLVTSPRRK